MPDEQTQRALAEEILADARRQADKVIGRARRNADRILAAARTATENIEQEALRKAEQTIENITRRLLADIPRQEQLHAISVKDDVIERLFEEVAAMLRSQRGPDILPVLAGLSAEGMAALGGQDFVLEVRAEDAALIGDDLESRSAAIACQTLGHPVSAHVVPSDAIPDGGVIVRTKDGRRMVDNSFATRMERTRDRLRNQIAGILFGRV